MPVSIGQANITHAEVARAASDTGMSTAQLRDLASQLQTLAQGMSFGDGTALSALAAEINQAAGQVGHATTRPEPFAPNAGGTAPPGT